MDIDIKRIIMFASSSIGFFNNKSNFKGLNCDDEIKQMIPLLDKILEKAFLKVPNRDKETEKLVKKINAKKIYFDIITQDDMHRKNKKEIDISRKNRDILAEHAINYACVNCKRNFKRCALKTAMLQCEVPVFHEEEGKCPYKND